MDKKKLLILLIWGFAVMGKLWAAPSAVDQFIQGAKDLPNEAKQSMMQAYEEAAQYFAQKGDKQRAKHMQQMADALRPYINTETNPVPPIIAPQPVPEAQPEQGKEPPVAVLGEPVPARDTQTSSELAMAYPTINQLPALGDSAEDAIPVLISRYLVGILTKNLPLILSTLAPSIDMVGYDFTLNDQQQYVYYSEILAQYQFDALEMSDLYDIDSQPSLQLLDDKTARYTLLSVSAVPSALQHMMWWPKFFGSVHQYIFVYDADLGWRMAGWTIKELV
jgi:hypothetical protein